MKKVIIITGPTAVGKTKLSIEVAKNFQMPLINGDAYQIYKHLDILTAKPTKEEMENVHHYLMDELDPKTNFSIYDYQKLVRNLIEKIELPIIVGGSGLYIDSVIYDYRFSENNEYKLGEIVAIEENRPISKTKSWVVKGRVGVSKDDAVEVID